MKAERVYVFGHRYDGMEGMPPETRDVCNGLFEMYERKASWVALYNYKPSPSLAKEAAGQSGASPFDYKVGAYVVFHESGPEGAMITGEDSPPDHLVKSVLKASMGDDFARLGKLVFIACNLAPAKKELQPLANQEITAIEAITGRAYILSVLLELNREGVTPRLVGWDSYISALPHTGGSTVYPSPFSSGKKVSKEELAKSAGRKVGRKKRLGLVAGQEGRYRKEHKRTFWVADGKLIIEGAEGWSD